MEEILFEYVPALIVFIFFLSAFCLVTAFLIWIISIVQNGWWSSASHNKTRWVQYFSISTAVPLSVMALAAPQADSDMFWVLVMWIAIGLLVALSTTQASGIAHQEGIV